MPTTPRDIAPILERMLDAWLPRKIEYDRIPGIAVGVVHGGKLLYSNGFGVADLASATPLTAQTGFRIASISKLFTAVAILQLVERGKLRLDDRITTILPWVAAGTRGEDIRAVTIRQLLSHTSGLFRDGITGHWEDDRFPTTAELRASANKNVVVFQNLTRFKYSNFGFALLGEVIRAKSGMSYDAYMAKHILRPLRMQHTATDYRPAHAVWLATGHARPIPGMERGTYKHVRTNAYAAATGFLSNVPDLARFLSALSSTRKGPLLSHASLRELVAPIWNTEENASYGLGCEIQKLFGQTTVGHSGGFSGFITQMAYDRASDLGVIVLTNTNDSAASSICTGIFHMAGVLQQGFLPASTAKSAAKLRRYEGVYRSRWNDTIIMATGAQLVSFGARANMPLYGATTLVPRGKHRFRMETEYVFDSPGEDAAFTFVRGKRSAQQLLWGAQPMERIG